MLTPRMRNPILAAVILGLVCAFSAVGAGINPEPAEIKCSVDSDRPQLFFDFRLHVPFVVEIPRKQLAGPENRLRIRIQVTPISPAKKPVELNSEMRMPALEEARGGLEFSGSLAVGLGRYDVRWSLEDEFGRTCTVRWALEGGLDKKNRHVQLAIPP